MQVWRISIRENPGCLMALTIVLASSWMFWPSAEAAKTSGLTAASKPSGSTGVETEPRGVDLVFEPFGVVGDVWPVVRE